MHILLTVTLGMDGSSAREGARVILMELYRPLVGVLASSSVLLGRLMEFSLQFVLGFVSVRRGDGADAQGV